MPRIMPAPSDGRAFTNYMSAGQYEVRMQRELGATSEAQYRATLQHNASEVAARMRRMRLGTVRRARAT
jgi:hypothetical protein